MNRPRRNRPLLLALYVNAVLLAAVLLALLSRGPGPNLMPAAYGAPPTQAQPIAGGANLYLMPAQFTTYTYGCYIMDIDAQTLCAYQYFSGDHQLKLVAARNFHFDRKLGAYNTSPSWVEIQKLTDLEKANIRATEEHPTTQSPEAPENNK